MQVIRADKRQETQSYKDEHLEMNNKTKTKKYENSIDPSKKWKKSD